MVTRWNSTYDMADSILMNKEAIQSMAIDIDPTNKAIRLNILTEDEFEIIDDFCSLLRPLKELTEFLSGRKYVTCSILYPAIYSLINLHLDMPDLKTPILISLKEELKRTLTNRFRYLFNEKTGIFF